MKIYDFKVRNAKGVEVPMTEYQGKVLLIVNTATGCGFTPQYEGLQKLYDKYRDRGLEILDFPCNQFGHQAPGTEEEIQEFCTLNTIRNFHCLPRLMSTVRRRNRCFHFSRIRKEASSGTTSNGTSRSSLSHVTEPSLKGMPR